jgi:hypothetical protein
MRWISYFILAYLIIAVQMALAGSALKQASRTRCCQRRFYRD